MCSPLLEKLVLTAEKKKVGAERQGLLGRATNLLALVDPETATLYSTTLARSRCSGSLRSEVKDSGYEPAPLDPILTNTNLVDVSRRAAATIAAVGQGVHGPLAALAALPAAREPLPCRLSTQDLVELLKMPTCFGADRQVVLAHLGNRYGRHFETHWDFVRFAQEQGLDLDITTPPQRPDRKLPPLFTE
jgi:hypothetical protein